MRALLTSLSLALLIAMRVAAPAADLSPQERATASDAPSAAPESDGSIVALTYNIHHGAGMDGRIDLPRLARVIQSVKPHVVALQEVDKMTSRSAGVDQAAELGRLTGMEVRYGSSMDYQGGQYGNAILSRLPIVDFKVVPLPGSPEREPRSLSVAELRLPGEDNQATFLFLATHLDHTSDSADRLMAGKRIQELAAQRPTMPTLLAGDLNATPDSPLLRLLEPDWAGGDAEANLFTSPAQNPVRQIDYILYRPAEAWQVVESRVLDEPVASDHRPLMTRFVWRGSPTPISGP